MLKILALDHITINLLKPEESYRFYENVLGLEKIRDVDMGDHELHLYHLADATLELISYKESQQTVQAGNTDVGVYRHFAVVTDNLQEAYRRCVEAGYGINLKPTFIPQIGKDIILVKDPNGVEIEIVQG